jgi:hypothetical protein
MQHQIYWGRLKKPIEWSLKTWMAPWSYIASVIYHDLYWYPRNSRRQMMECLNSEWGRLFKNWETLAPDKNGWQDVGSGPSTFVRNTAELLRMGLGVLGHAIVEAPEVAARRRRRKQKQ